MSGSSIGFHSMASKAPGGDGKGTELCSSESGAELELILSGLGSLAGFSVASSSVQLELVSGSWMIFFFSPTDKSPGITAIASVVMLVSLKTTFRLTITDCLDGQYIRNP